VHKLNKNYKMNLNIYCIDRNVVSVYMYNSVYIDDIQYIGDNRIYRMNPTKIRCRKILDQGSLFIVKTKKNTSLCDFRSDNLIMNNISLVSFDKPEIYQM
jgi:hypothetical protein